MDMKTLEGNSKKNNSVREVEKADKIKKKAKIELFESMTGANAFSEISGPVI